MPAREGRGERKRRKSERCQRGVGGEHEWERKWESLDWPGPVGGRRKEAGEGKKRKEGKKRARESEREQLSAEKREKPIRKKEKNNKTTNT